MLEKLGLPAKPSMRGGSWVVDASHCQGCSSQFTFLNRKHHCRRCGGLFCNSCTQQRMILRGQGDSPVRICDPCKKLEDAARFEMRYGHKNRAAKGTLKLTPKHEDEVLNQILSTDGKQHSLSARESTSDTVSGTQRSMSSTSCSNFSDEVEREGDILQSSSMDVPCLGTDDLGSQSPEKLRQQAQEEKKKYGILKREGKPDEALRAFKRGKELERQAEALELAMRKNRKKVLSSSSLAGTQSSNDGPEGSGRKTKVLPEWGKGEKDDLATELRELGWSDADLHDADKKPPKTSLEGELSNLLREIPRKSDVGKGISGGIDKSQVLAHKRKALMFKREGKLTEAKEELKRAKVLEKQIEEQEFLGQEEESDDEIASLIQSMDDDKEDLALDFSQVPSFDVRNLTGNLDDLTADDDFEVTNDDMNDPEIAAALKSFGWIEGADHEEKVLLQPVSVDREALEREVVSLKREALNQKRAGNVTEAMAQLRKAKLLEKDLENLQTREPYNDQDNISAQNLSDKNLASQNTGKPSMLLDDNDELGVDGESIKTTMQPRKSRAAIQKELLGLKKKALALRREGKLDEAEEELKKGKVLEHQLEEMDNPLKVHQKLAIAENSVLQANEDVEEVSEQDMRDPALLSLLKNFGWKEEDETLSLPVKSSKHINSNSESHDDPSLTRVQAPRCKAEMQKELLSLKRKALQRRRQGRSEEAEEELRKAKVLETQMEEFESSQQGLLVGSKNEGLDGIGSSVGQEKHGSEMVVEEVTQIYTPSASSKNTGSRVDDLVGEVSNSKFLTPTLEIESKQNLPHRERQIEISTSAEEKMGSNFEPLSNVVVKREISADNARRDQTHEANPVMESDLLVAPMDQSSDQQEVLAHKRKAVALKREGKLAEAREELRKAKILEKSLEGDRHLDTIDSSRPGLASSDTPCSPETKKNQTHKPVSGRDRFKLQQESLAHKRQALKLRREGRVEESEAEFELAKSLQSQMEELDARELKIQKPVGGETMEDATVEDILDPQLLSALQAIGWQESEIIAKKPEKPEVKSGNLDRERGELEERIKVEKVRALELKRAGKQGDALDALRRAKQLEKKLNSLAA